LYGKKTGKTLGISLENMALLEILGTFLLQKFAFFGFLSVLIFEKSAFL